jgi:hypothetical protein
MLLLLLPPFFLTNEKESSFIVSCYNDKERGRKKTADHVGPPPPTRYKGHRSGVPLSTPTGSGVSGWIVAWLIILSLLVVGVTAAFVATTLTYVQNNLGGNAAATNTLSAQLSHVAAVSSNVTVRQTGTFNFTGYAQNSCYCACSNAVKSNYTLYEAILPPGINIALLVLQLPASSIVFTNNTCVGTEVDSLNVLFNAFAPSFVELTTLVTTTLSASNQAFVNSWCPNGGCSTDGSLSKWSNQPGAPALTVSFSSNPSALILPVTIPAATASVSNLTFAFFTS